ncbi:hypothetical protein MNB_SV-13-429 [hydrothermal vent metagenome]|uniref:Uncharacterized protein n=1 Tax=hydrothermal vent metagenome TaxID=652676 RepID=A0A1W1BIM6_9ZZZZ
MEGKTAIDGISTILRREGIERLKLLLFLMRYLLALHRYS